MESLRIFRRRIFPGLFLDPKKTGAGVFSLFGMVRQPLFSRKTDPARADASGRLGKGRRLVFRKKTGGRGVTGFPEGKNGAVVRSLRLFKTPDAGVFEPRERSVEVGFAFLDAWRMRSSLEGLVKFLSRETAGSGFFLVEKSNAYTRPVRIRFHRRVSLRRVKYRLFSYFGDILTLEGFVPNMMYYHGC
ncbi:MAG: hypothetical protein LBR53_11905 [Deltaproteobacteria bacterium]|jgi:hypothetical protein|nr:hypothetical protein [Deltaproteobacteria bacterium]